MQPPVAKPIVINLVSQQRAFNLCKALPLSRALDGGDQLEAVEILDVLTAAKIPHVAKIGDANLEHTLPAMLAALDMLLGGDAFEARTWPTERASALGAAMRSFYGGSAQVLPDAPPRAHSVEHALAKQVKAIFEGKDAQWSAFVKKSIDITAESAQEAAISKGNEFLSMAALDAYLKRHGTKADSTAITRFSTGLGDQADALSERVLLWLMRLGKQMAAAAAPALDLSMLPSATHSVPDFAGDEDERRARSALRADAMEVAKDVAAQRKLADLLALCDDPTKLQLALEKETSEPLRRLLRSGDDVEKALHGTHAFRTRRRASHTRDSTERRPPLLAADGTRRSSRQRLLRSPEPEESRARHAASAHHTMDERVCDATPVGIACTRLPRSHDLEESRGMLNGHRPGIP